MTAASALAVVFRCLLSLAVLLGFVPLAVWLERKGSAYIQDRPGPCRAALFGIFRLGGITHVIADVIKLLSKEDVIPARANRTFFTLAPWLAAMVPLLTFAIVPLADDFAVAGFRTPLSALRIEGGLLWFLAIASLSVYGIVFAGWASGNKFGLLGSLRSTAQLLSYEIGLALAILGPVLAFGTVEPNDIVSLQGGVLWGWLPQWGIILQPVAFLLFVVCAFAEINRVPFDLAEGEAELVAGYHTEYSGMRFGMFFMAEYMALVTSGGLAVTLFLGGYQIPFLPTRVLIDQVGVLLPGFLTVGALVALGVGGLCWRHYVGYTRGRWGDGRDLEPLIFAIVASLLAVVMLGLAGAALAAHGQMVAWIPPLFAALLQISAFVIKLAFFCWVFVWVRWTLPRFRYDQLMALGWKSLLPIGLLNLLVTGVVLLPIGPLTWELLAGAGVIALVMVWLSYHPSFRCADASSAAKGLAS